MNYTFLKNIKVNDKVNFNTLGSKKIAIVTKITKSTIVLDGFPVVNRKNGDAKGSYSTFSRPWITEID